GGKELAVGAQAAMYREVILFPLEAEALLPRGRVPAFHRIIVSRGQDLLAIRAESDTGNLGCVPSQGEQIVMAPALPVVPLEAAQVPSVCMLRPLTVEEVVQTRDLPIFPGTLREIHLPRIQTAVGRQLRLERFLSLLLGFLSLLFGQVLRLDGLLPGLALALI